MQRKVSLLPAIALAVFLLATMGYFVVVPIGKITLNQTQYEKSSLFLPFKFNEPQLFVLCEFGVDPAAQRCVHDVVSDFITITSDAFGKGVASMISETAEGQLLTRHRIFHCPRRALRELCLGKRGDRDLTPRRPSNYEPRRHARPGDPAERDIGSGNPHHFERHSSGYHTISNHEFSA